MYDVIFVMLSIAFAVSVTLITFYAIFVFSYVVISIGKRVTLRLREKILAKYNEFVEKRSKGEEA